MGRTNLSLRSMDIARSFHVVTGAGRGIGRAIAVALARRGAAGVALIDVHSSSTAASAAKAAATNPSFKEFAIEADVSTRDGVIDAIALAKAAFGRVDGMVSNAGFAEMGQRGSLSAIGESQWTWEKTMNINCMSHVWAAESVVPDFQTQVGGGAFVSIVSAAGLLTQVGAPSYSVSKAAALAFSESLAVHHGDKGVRVHCVCPQAVATSLVGWPDEDLESGPPSGAIAGAAVDGVLSPAAVAEATVDAMERGTFLVLPHADVHGYVKMKAAAPDKSIVGMRKLRDAISAGKTPLVQS